MGAVVESFNKEVCQHTASEGEFPNQILSLDLSE